MRENERNQQGILGFQARYELLKQASSREQVHLNSSNSSNHEEIEGEWGKLVIKFDMDAIFNDLGEELRARVMLSYR